VIEGLQIPGDLDAISPAWMTAALSESHPDAEVSAVAVVMRDDGTNRRARLALTYAHGSGPATVFIKAGDPAHAELNARMGGVFNEPRLFRSGVHLPLDHPHVYLALIDEPTLDFVLVMEDISTRGADPRDSTRPLTIDQAANGVRALARLHGAYWGERLSRETALAWVDPFVAWQGMGGGIAKSIEKAGDTIPAEVRAMTGEQIVGDYWTRYIGTLGDGPATLLHGDPHIGNTYVLPDDEVGFLDWQVLRHGNFSHDLGYFLQGAVAIDDRRTSEADLIDEYRAALDLPADEKPTRDEIWLRYRASVAYGLAIWLATFSYGGWQREDVSLALVQRYAAAFVDLDTAAAIDQLTH
jgi:Phosphotransferase enzyme family